MGNKSKIIYLDERSDYQKHPDEEWMQSKFKGRSGMFEWDNRFSPAKIGYIYGVPRYKIRWYNLILYLKWVRRNFIETFRGLR